jgi:hypothetical protein
LRKTPEPPQQHRVACFWGVLLLILPLVKCSFNNFTLLVQSIASGTKIFAYVADDPDTLFQVVSCSGTTVVAAMGIAAIGTNIALIQNAGSTTTGNSAVAIDEGTETTTNTLPIRIIDVVRETATGADAFVEFIVKINIGTHQYTNSTGV